MLKIILISLLLISLIAITKERYTVHHVKNGVYIKNNTKVLLSCVIGRYEFYLKALDKSRIYPLSKNIQCK